MSSHDIFMEGSPGRAVVQMSQRSVSRNPENILDIGN